MKTRIKAKQPPPVNRGVSPRWSSDKPPMRVPYSMPRHLPNAGAPHSPQQLESIIATMEGEYIDLEALTNYMLDRR